jgi:hypothetical protein
VIPAGQCLEVTRLVSERPGGIVAGSLLVPLGLIQAVSVYTRRHAIRCGLAVVKQQLLRALHAGRMISKASPEEKAAMVTRLLAFLAALELQEPTS